MIYIGQSLETVRYKVKLSLTQVPLRPSLHRPGRSLHQKALEGLGRNRGLHRRGPRARRAVRQLLLLQRKLQQGLTAAHIGLSRSKLLIFLLFSYYHPSLMVLVATNFTNSTPRFYNIWSYQVSHGWDR